MDVSRDVVDSFIEDSDSEIDDSDADASYFPGENETSDDSGE